ncbi:ABC transporter transmembrane domain-containing protein [Glaciecola siphonariae]|uniref:ABC transporter transmembrane domain-containing protein n=1 Tax=Glaciecola siphonariae TaxID=521012 RepID=A0ABV9LVB3_9ALTE
MSSSKLIASISPKILIISLAIMLLSLALPVALLQTYDRIIPNQSYGTAWVIALGVIIAILLEGCLRYGRAWILNRQGMRFEAWSAVKGVESVLASKRAVSNADKVELLDGFAALKRYQDYHSGQALLALYDAPFVVVFLIMIAYIGGNLVFIPITILCIAFITVYILSLEAKSSLQRAETSQLAVNHLLNHIFQHIFSLRAKASQRKIVSQFNRQQSVQSEAQAKTDKFFMHMQLTTTFFSQATTVLIVMLSAHYVIEGQMTSGALAACTLLAGRTMAPVSALFSFWGQLQKATSVKVRAQAMLETESDSPASIDNNAVNVGVIAESAVPRFSDKAISFRVKPGSIVRFEEPGDLRIGSLFHHLARQQAMQQGELYCADEAGKRVSGRVCYVGSSTSLFEGSVLENLTLFNSDLENEAMTLSREVGLYSKVVALSQGFDTKIGMHKLSGLEKGMEQQIAIVRAFIAKPHLLVLDHADAGLDFKAQQALANYLQSKTFESTVIVTTFSEPLKESVSATNMQIGERHE